MKPVLIALLLTLPIFIKGQVCLSDILPASADSLEKCRIRHFSPGKGGKNKVWDFSGKLKSRESSKVLFMKDSTDILSIQEKGKISYYKATPDSLILLASESPLERRKYATSKFSRRFPLELGDSISRFFRSEGMYCGNHPFREKGMTTMKVDGTGTIIFAENDSIRNIRRVHTIETYTVCMDLSVVALDTAKLTQVIDERYEWFVQGSQYPIIENITSTTYFNMTPVGTTRYAYCNLPEDKVAYYITSTDDDTEDDEDLSCRETSEHDIIHYSIEVRGGVINIAYNLDEDATISTIVANHMGMTYRHRQWTQEAGQGYTAQIDCNGLPKGTYILYINVNGKAYSEKVTL